MSSVAQAVLDGRIIAWRSFKRVPRIPKLAIFAILQSISPAWLLGLRVKTVEVAQQLGFLVIFPLTCLSNVVRVDGDPPGRPAADRRMQPDKLARCSKIRPFREPEPVASRARGSSPGRCARGSW